MRARCTDLCVLGVLPTYRFADALFGLVADHGLVDRVPESLPAFGGRRVLLRETVRPWLVPETSLVDEALMILLAGAGVYSQLVSGFKIFFPLDLVLFPLTVVEWFLRYQITFGGAGTASTSSHVAG